MRALVYDITPARWVLCKAASLLSRQVYSSSLSGLRLVARPIPPLPGPGWVRLRTLLGGVCGTDIALIMQRTHPATLLKQFASFPAVLGHENVAEIDEVGAEVPNWQRGQRVCADPALGCQGRGIEPLCGPCAVGRTSVCEHPGDNRYPPRALIGLNTQTGGSWAEYFLAHHTQLHAVPDEIPDEIAVQIDPIASSVHTVLRRPPLAGESVLVCGSGIVAFGVIAAIRAQGYDNTITAIVRHRFQADIAKHFGATDVLCHSRAAGKIDRYREVASNCGATSLKGTAGNHAMIGGYDLVYECTGIGSALNDALKWTRSRGSLVAVGTSGIGVLDFTPVWFDELQIIGVNGRQIEDYDNRKLHTYEIVIEWLKTGRLDLKAIPIVRYRLSDYRKAMQDLANRSKRLFVKATFDPRLA